MPSLLPSQYPVDLTGNSLNNLIVGEQHTLVGGRTRCVALNFSPFFKKNITVYANGQPLSSTQYKCLHIESLASQKAGMGNESYAILAITDQSVPGTITVDYHTVGGSYVKSYTAALKMLQTLTQDTRPTSYPNFTDRPDGFNPTMHLHALGDVVGWEYVVAAIDNLCMVALMGDTVGHEALVGYIDQQTTALSTMIANATSGTGVFGLHIANQNNPHNVSKGDVGLDLVQNYRVATAQEAIAGTRTDLYMTPSTTSAAIGALQANELGDHPNNKNNPHETSKEQVGLGFVQNYGVANNTQALAGTATDLYMTPATTKAVADNRLATAQSALTGHTGNTGNPHGTTKGDIGLSNLQNYGVASNAATVAGTSAVLYVTPAGLRAVTTASETAQAQLVNNHAQNTGNPHNVNKQQVGLGLVSNYATASIAQALAGTSNVLYMTPAGVSAVIIDSPVGDKLDSALVGAANGAAPLNADGVIPASYLTLTPGSNIRDVHAFLNGKPSVGVYLVRHLVIRDSAFEIESVNNRAYCAERATASFNIDILKNDSVIGHIVFSPGSNSAVFTKTGLATVNFTAGDRLDVICEEVVQDATLADINLVLFGMPY